MDLGPFQVIFRAEYLPLPQMKKLSAPERQEAPQGPAGPREPPQPPIPSCRLYDVCTSALTARCV